MKIARRVRFYGQVQGVNFRRNLMNLAVKQSIKGWVRNMHDGSVEAHLEGEPGEVQTLIQRCCTDLFPARVEKYHSDEDELKNYDDFKIIM